MWVLRGSLRWSAVLFLSPSSPTGPATTGYDCRGPTRLEAKEGSGSFGGSESPGEALLTPAGSAIKDPCSYLGNPVHPLPEPLLPAGPVQKRQRRPESAEPECLSGRGVFHVLWACPCTAQVGRERTVPVLGLKGPSWCQPQHRPHLSPGWNPR